MKRIIEGLRYDTATSTELASHGHENLSEPGAERETLFRTGKGRFFLMGQGGPLSRYAMRTPNGYSFEGSDLRPLSDQEVCEWLEEHSEVELFEELFPEAFEDA